MAHLNVSSKSLVKARQEREALERQAAGLFRALLKAERGRSGPGAALMPARERLAREERVKLIDAEIRKLRRALRRIGAGQ
jgi:hypothetical protein